MAVIVCAAALSAPRITLRGVGTPGWIPSGGWTSVLQWEYTCHATVDTPLQVPERPLEHRPNWGVLIGLAFCLEVWLLVAVVVAERT